MEIVYFKVPVSLTRDNQGQVSMKMFEADKKEDKREPIDIQPTEIVNYAKMISDYNEKQKLTIKSTLLRTEDSCDTFITIKMLV